MRVDCTIGLPTLSRRYRCVLLIQIPSTIAQGQPADLVAQQVERIDALLDRAQEKLGAEGLTPAGAFTSSLLILLREGESSVSVQIVAV